MAEIQYGDLLNIERLPVDAQDVVTKVILVVAGNRAVTTAANLLFNCYIRDLETCFKLMPLDLYRKLDVRSAGFGMEAEITGKLLRLGYRPWEVPVSYRARSRAEGKKLTWRDGVAALAILARTRLARPPIRPSA